jgi:hypothetical protein
MGCLKILQDAGVRTIPHGEKTLTKAQA